LINSRKVVIPVKLVLAKAGNGNPELIQKRHGFLLEFIPVKTGAGMTENSLFRLFTKSPKF